MEFKGTKGEWVVEDDDFICCGEKTIAAIGSVYPLDEEDRNNRALILSAPDLLEALQAAMDYIDAIPKDIVLPAMPGFDRDWVDGVISKALGEE